MINRQMTSLSDTRRDYSPAVRLGHDAVSAVKLSQELTAEIDAWAETHQITRSDAISRLLELGLGVAPPPRPRRLRMDDPAAIEQRTISLIDQMLDPALPPDERERRIRRLIEGPPEFASERIDLPKPAK
ncbi:hypothetical protein ACQR1Y_21240 [Bradyrhizobium sp. HKCCYLRH3099]|uniref:hypothetical protein n=1 Tax=unclassified Bradyrhizobium TaxID=2631580 RepID=UPI003EBA4756